MATIVAGASAGLLLGVLVGLSSSPVVGTVVGALATLGAAFLTNKDLIALESEPRHARLSALRRWGTASLCVACLAGVFLGLVIRTRDLLSPTPAQQVARWTRAGFPPIQARAIVAGSLVQSREEKAAASSSPPPIHASVLFAGASAKCDDLNPNDHADANLQQAFETAGGSWHAVAKEANAVADAAARRRLLVEVWSAVCR